MDLLGIQVALCRILASLLSSVIFQVAAHHSVPLCQVPNMVSSVLCATWLLLPALPAPRALLHAETLWPTSCSPSNFPCLE